MEKPRKGKDFSPEKYGMIFCPDCGGSGKSFTDPKAVDVCEICGGSGAIKKEEEQKVKKKVKKVAYVYYRCNGKGTNDFIGILIEKRKIQERINQESIINYGRKAILDNTEAKDISFTQIAIDETQIQSGGLISIS
jgi:DnaJ-class molecular chaperone